MLYIILFIIFIIVLFILHNYFKIKDLDETIDICEEKIFELLDYKKDFIEEIIKLLKDDELKNMFDKLNIDDLFIYENSLYDIHFKINKDFKLNKKTNEIYKNLNKVDEEIDGLKDFYNMNANKYNDLYKKKILNLLFKALKFKEKEIFKIRKIEEFNILKD